MAFLERMEDGPPSGSIIWVTAQRAHSRWCSEDEGQLAQLVPENQTIWDVALKKAVEENHDSRSELTAAFVYPSLGHWDSHESMHGFGVRYMHSDETWINSGTRRPQELTALETWKGFQIRQFVQKGWAPVLREQVKFPEHCEELQWWTAALSVDPALTARMI